MEHHEQIEELLRESILAAKLLMVLSASIILTLGVVHLAYTFWGPKLMPREPAL